MHNKKNNDKNNQDNELNINDYNIDNINTNESHKINNSTILKHENSIDLAKLNILEEINDVNIENDSTIKLKNKNEIYLEIYKEALKKAKQIRSNAIDAFLQAKSIKNKYNLADIINSDSSDSN